MEYIRDSTAPKKKPIRNERVWKEVLLLCVRYRSSDNKTEYMKDRRKREKATKKRVHMLR